MAKLSRRGDVCLRGGIILIGAKTVFAEGKAVGLHPSLMTPHLPQPKHLLSVTTGGSSTVFAEGKAVLMFGSGCTCGCMIIQGSSSINCS